MRKLTLLLILFLAGCATIISSYQLNERFGQPDPARFDHPTPPVAGAPDYWRDIRPLLDQRCVSCHACYDSPCQLNLSSYEGLTRGANPAEVYSGIRLTPAEPTRLGFDALTNAGWRNKGFFPVLNERRQTPEANSQGSVMYRILNMKQKMPGPSSGKIKDTDLDFSLSRDQICVHDDAMDDYAKQHPSRGMPFGLPPLNHDEHQTLARWIEAGAPYTPPPALSAALLKEVSEWEAFLNGNTLKEQLTARYIYEHWFVGQFYFNPDPQQFFQIVRSTTPPGQPIKLIVTRRPYDDPTSSRVYYRLRPTENTQVVKTYLPIKLDRERMARIRGWFLTPDYTVTALPSYKPKQASNPFITFQALPIDARYSFMLDEAQFTLAGFMKGPVCRGQVALSVITDYFWVAFVAPNPRENQAIAALLASETSDLQLPAEYQSDASIWDWRGYAKLENSFLAAKRDAMVSLSEQNLPNLSLIWDGDGKNPNAALTVFRHFDSASVMQGFAGERPQTMLVIGYPLFERMHYLLLAGFDIYGDTGHQLATRLYMDFLRMEGELNFLAFLPKKNRQTVRDYWYRGLNNDHKTFLTNANDYFPQKSGIKYRTKDHLSELYQRLSQRMAPVRNPSLDWTDDENLNPNTIQQLKKLSKIHGLPASNMPEQSLLLLRQADKSLKIISLVRNSAHSNVARIIDPKSRRLPKEDTLLALNGVVGAYPNAFYSLSEAELPDFVRAVSELSKGEDLTQLTESFGIRRTDPRFWPLSDELHREWRRSAPREAAILDYSRFENN